MNPITIIGGGLAGCEAAWQVARFGVPVRLLEMRPHRMTEAHTSGDLAELVCSNSLRSRELSTGPGLLKEELRLAGSLIMEAALRSEVAAGTAFAVDRTIFSAAVTKALDDHPLVTVLREEVAVLPEDGIVILASGPLTAGALADAITALIGDDDLHFYDAIAPIIDAESIDRRKVYAASRYGKGGDDYINCPMSRDEYERFYDALMAADSVIAHEFENTRVFEGCMPVEVMARRGRDTLRFGPLKPVGLRDPRTGNIPYAVVQLRPENLRKTSYNMVGFQTRLRWPEQQRVFSLIPGLEQAEFFRYGSIHRNTFINAPRHLNSDLSLKERATLYLAGQLTGVEGYVESTAIGFLAGINAALRALGREAHAVPRATAHGGLMAHLIESDPRHFEPSNINFGLLPMDEAIGRVRDKKLKRKMIAERALAEWAAYCSVIDHNRGKR